MMNHRFLITLCLASSSALALFVSACGGSDNSNADAGNDATTNDATNDAVADTSNDTNNGDAGPDAAPDGSCGAGAGCRACCAGLYPDAAAAVLANETTCACTTPGDCATPCANSLCNNKASSNACNQCLRNVDAGDCQNSAATACKNDTACAPFVTCLAQCILPPKDAGGGG